MQHARPIVSSLFEVVSIYLFYTYFGI